MSQPMRDEIQRRKRQLRTAARAARELLPDRARLSAEIVRRLTSLPEYQTAGVISCYVNTDDEVHTRALFPLAWSAGKRVAVPYIAEGRIALFRLESLDELSPGHYGILEPRPALRGVADRRVEPVQLDLVVVPGVAFDRRGGRLGHGKGYYDSLLPCVRPETGLLGLAFECQMVDEVPMLPHDVFLHAIITETAVYASHGP